MEELHHILAVEIWNNYIARPQNDPTKYKFSFKDLEKIIKEHINKIK